MEANLSSVRFMENKAGYGNIFVCTVIPIMKIRRPGVVRMGPTHAICSKGYFLTHGNETVKSSYLCLFGIMKTPTHPQDGRENVLSL